MRDKKLVYVSFRCLPEERDRLFMAWQRADGIANCSQFIKKAVNAIAEEEVFDTSGYKSADWKTVDMGDEREVDKLIIAAAKALGKEKFTITDVYYAIHQRKPRGNERPKQNLQPSSYRIRGALERNCARIVERWSKTSKPYYSFSREDDA